MADKEVTVTHTVSEEAIDLLLAADRFSKRVFADFMFDLTTILEEIDHGHHHHLDGAITRADTSGEFSQDELRKVCETLKNHGAIVEDQVDNQQPHLELV